MDTTIRKSEIKAVVLYNLFFIIAAVVFYFLIPIMLNYPPNSINNEFEQTIDAGMQYHVQYLLIMGAAIIVSNFFFISQIKKVKKYKLYINKSDDASKKKLAEIKKKCFSLPYKIYLIHATVPSISIFCLLYLTGAQLILTERIVVLIFSFTIVLGLLAYIFSKNVFNKVLTELGNMKKYSGKIKISFKNKIFMLFLPLFFLVLLFITIMSNRLLSTEKGDFINENYANQLALHDVDKISTIDEIKELLKNVKKFEQDDTLFIITKNDVIYADNDAEISDFFRKYTYDVAENGHTYGYYVTGIQGTFRFITVNGIEYAAGIMYKSDSESSYLVLIYTMMVLMCMCIFFLSYFSREIGEQVTVVSDNLRKIANEETMDYNQKLPVVSNDELGDLAISFNKILDLEKKHADEMEKNQEMLIEQERLSSLGQLIGGIAHNLKTPIMSISGAAQAIKNLTEEYRKSVGNPQVTVEDHYAIAKDIDEWNEKIGTYLTYMTEIINAAKGQAVSMNASTVNDFSMEELIIRVKILMKEELTQKGCVLSLENNINKDLQIKGELSAIVQVLDNLIINAIDAYGNKPGNINLRLSEDNDKVYIEVQDFAGGIPKNVQEKLFKQMITTKGKNGTGLGLYMCYSTIKGKFNGEMRFETQEGKGTTFFIELNK